MQPDNYLLQNKQVIFTISDANYAAISLTMFDSVSKYYQDSDLFLFVVGKGQIRKLDGNITVIYIDDILDKLDLNQRLAYYLNVELATSIRPQCFEFLFAKNYEKAIYLDPDVYVFRRMTEIDDLLNEGGINGVVTPHALHSDNEGKNCVIEGDNIFLQCGIFNMGFFALKNTVESLRMLAWWREKLKWKCVVDVRNGYFVDQKWLNFLPVYFDSFYILRLPTYNLAPWNCHFYNILSDSNGKFFINNFKTPIAFIHYSGIKRSNHHYLHMKEAYDFYLEQIHNKRFIKLDFVNYEVKFEKYNIFFDKICTFLYKDYVNNTKDTKSNPLVEAGFYNYLNSIDYETKLPVYIRKLYEVLPDIFVRYLGTNLTINYDNLIGFIKNNFPYDGVVSLETMVQLRSHGIQGNYEIKYENSCKVNTSFPALQQTNKKIITSHAPAIHTFCDNTRRSFIPQNTSQLRKLKVKADRIEITSTNTRVCIPSIGELEDISNLSYINAQNYNEVWVPSIYCREKLYEMYGLTNLVVIPYPVLKPKYTAQVIDLPKDKFVVMMSHDFNVDFTSQNSLASLKAFQKAFDKNDNALLVCFLFNAKQSKQYNILLKAFNNKQNVIIVKGGGHDDWYYSHLLQAHCFISLHQEIVFGYILAEAMSLGKLVIATSKGGNTEYMNVDNSFLIEDISPSRCMTRATNILKSLYNEVDVLNFKSKNARLFIQKHLSPHSVGYVMQKRIEALEGLEKPKITKNKRTFLSKLSHKLDSFLRPYLRKIPLFVIIYRKIKLVRAPYFSAKTTKNKRTFLSKLSHKLDTFLRPYLRKIPLFVIIYRKIKLVRTRNFLTKRINNHPQISAIVMILLKNVNRPGVLE